MGELCEMICKLICFYDNIDENTTKKILDIFSLHNYTKYDLNLSALTIFIDYFTNINVIKHLSDFINSDGDIGIHIGVCICNRIKAIKTNTIHHSSKDIINEKVENYKKIIYNLYTLNYKSDICRIVSFLYEITQNCKTEESKMENNFIFELQNYIFNELNLSNTIEYSDTLNKILDKYK